MGGYQQYMKQYAGDYEKYMKQGGQGGQQSQGGDYQQYMKQYAGDYQKYMKQGGQGGQQSQSGDYQQYMQQYAGDYQKYMKQGGQGGEKEAATPVSLISTDSNNSSGNDYQKYYKGYTPDVKNWSNNEEVRDAFMAKYAGSYVNFNAMDSKQSGGDAFRNKYAGKYLPANVKNWSDQKEVRDTFTEKYGGSSINLDSVDSVKIDKRFNDESSQLSNSKSDVSPPSASVPPIALADSNTPVETHAATETASSEASDAHAAIELASIPKPVKQTAPHASLIVAAVAAALVVIGAFLVPSARKLRPHQALEPLLEVS